MPLPIEPTCEHGTSSPYAARNPAPLLIILVLAAPYTLHSSLQAEADSLILPRVT